MISAQKVRKSFGCQTVLSNVSFQVPDGSITGLIGPSGGGKSVLLKILGGILLPDSGTVSCGVAKTEISLMFQEGALFDSLTVFDNVAFPLVHGKVPSTLLPRREREEVLELVAEILARIGMSRAAFKLPGQLSGGMRRRVSLARALVSRPKIVLLDDPTAGLDPVSSSIIMDLIVELHALYRPTMIMVSHDLRRLLPVVASILALFHGQVAFDGLLEELACFNDPELHRFVSCRYDLGASGCSAV